jgi:sulfate permease, SulP family
MAAATTRGLVGDIYGGLTAAVVALPLALAFGVASGVGPISGLYGAIAVGFFAAVFGGTGSQVSGPTGPMTIVMGAIVTQFADNLPDAFAIVMLGGLLQIAFGLLRVGRYVSYTPYSVVSGFMSGIGIIIIVLQVRPFVGLEVVPGGPVVNIHSWPEMLSGVNYHAIIVAGASLAIMIFWPARLRVYLPSALAALIAGTLLALFVLPLAPVIGEVPTGLPDFYIPTVSFEKLPSIIQPALILALLGSIDSLLTSLVADSITRTRHNSNRELIGQGIGNMVSGLIGGLPGAGATMRTVVNVRAGGHSPISGALHAIVLLALVLGLGPIAEVIPHAALAGILVKVGWDIIDWRYLKHFRHAPRDKLMVMFVTLGLTVFVDLITAVAVGLILAGFVTARWMEGEELKGLTQVALPHGDSYLDAAEIAELEKANGDVGLQSLRGRFSYASARQLAQSIRVATSAYKVMIYDFTDTAHLDTSAAVSISELISEASGDGGMCYVTGLSDEAESILKSLGALDDLPDDHVIPDRLEAIRRAVAFALMP